MKNFENTLLKIFGAALLILFSSSISMAQKSPTKILLKNYRPHSIYHVKKTHITKAKYPVIDVHNHAKHAPSPQQGGIAHWVKQMNKHGIKKTIILSYSTGARFDSLDKVFAGKYPNRFIMYCGIDFTGYNKPGWDKKAIKELKRDHKEGARGVGELGDKGKGFFYSKPTAAWGMHADDPRMDPIWDECAKLHMPVSIHVGDPMWMYEKMDSTNDGLMNAYEWRRDNKKELSHAQVIQTLVNAVKKHPKTTFLACHYMNLTYDLPKLGKILDKYPNLYVDMGGRFAEMAAIPRAAKKFITKYQNRIMYGTDMQPTDNMYDTTFRVLQSADDHFYKTDLFDYHWPLYGLDLSNKVLKKIYYKNAEKILGINL